MVINDLDQFARFVPSPQSPASRAELRPKTHTRRDRGIGPLIQLSSSPAGLLAQRGRRVHGRSAQQARAPRPLRRTPCHRPGASHSRCRRTGRARTHPPLPRWHHAHGVLSGGLARTPRRARAPTARAPHPISRRVRARLSTATARRPVTPRHCRPQAPPVQGEGGVVVTDPARIERRRPAQRAHDLGRETSTYLRDRHHHLPRLRRPTAMDRGGPPSDVTEPAVIRKILLHVQSRAPPRGGSPDGNRPDPDPHFTLAG